MVQVGLVAVEGIEYRPLADVVVRLRGIVPVVVEQVGRGKPGFSAEVKELLWWTGYVLDPEAPIVRQASSAFEAVRRAGRHHITTRPGAGKRPSCPAPTRTT